MAIVEYVKACDIVIGDVVVFESKRMTVEHVEPEKTGPAGKAGVDLGLLDEDGGRRAVYMFGQEEMRIVASGKKPGPRNGPVRAFGGAEVILRWVAVEDFDEGYDHVIVKNPPYQDVKLQMLSFRVMQDEAE